jgi:hypothetical protein
MNIKSFITGIAFLAVATVSTEAAPPIVGGTNAGWNYSYIVRDLRWDGNENVIWFTASPANAANESYAFHYVYQATPNVIAPGNTMEEAKGLFSALSLARSLNKQIGFQIIGTAGVRFVFSAIHVMQ